MHYGWRKKIGLIFPSTGNAPEVEFHRYAPEGVAVSTTRVLFERVTPEGLEEMGGRVIEAARLLATGQPDLLVFACTTGSLIKGLGYDREIIDRMEQASGVKSITTTTAVIEALKTLGAGKLIVPTPYSGQVNAIEKKFLEDSGYEVLAIKGLDYLDPALMPKVTPDQMYRLTEELFTPEADTIFISCTGLGILDVIPMMERDFQRQVLTSNQTSLWHALRTLSIRDQLPLGHLFTR
ncbi:MAG: maleate cis-trans isomerase [Candidatus Adiutrix sp.]|jgi:maleate isomerase|nr:maleate cis-trans isomerase [Candidatus Adiutrix sp.]